MARKSRKILSFLLAAVLALNIAAPAVAAKKAAKTTLKTKKVSLTVGKTKKIVLKNKKKGARYQYRSQAPKKASVSSKGVIKARKKGSTKIIVKEIYKKKNKTIGTIKVTVKAKKSSKEKENDAAGETDEPKETSAPPALTPSASPSSAPSEVPTPSSVPTQTAEPTPDPTVEPTPRPTPDINPPQNYLSKQDGVSYGSKRSITYYSTTTGKDRKANIIFPAGYTTEKKYPVLYLFHGVGGTENEWFQGGKPNEIVSNLVAQGSAKEMILVFPNIRCRANDEDTEMSLEAFQAFDNFINDLRDNLMPYIESHYSVATGRENTAIAGLSMGGREALYIGLSMAEKIGYVGAFEPAVGVLPYDREPGLFTEDTMKLPEEYNDNTYIMIVKGNEDTTVGEWPRTYHQTLEKNGVPHTYYEMPGPHSFTVWNNGLYNFARVIF